MGQLTMIEHSKLLNAFNTKNIISIFIDGTIYPYMTLKDIQRLHKRFGNNNFDKRENEYGDKNRADAFEELLEFLDTNENIKKFVNYFILELSLTDEIEDIIRGNQSTNNPRRLFKDEMKTYPDNICKIVVNNTENRNKIISNLRNEFIQRLNDELQYSKLKIIERNGIINILDLKQNKPIDLSIYSSVLTETRLHKMLLDAQRELQDGDFDTIVTKSRTILETTFMYILKEHNVKFKKNTTMKTFRDLVTRVLNMQDRDGKWGNDVKKLLSGLNKIIDAIGDMRNYHSDAHGRKDMFDNTVRRTKIHLAEAKLLLYSSINVAEYYLDINKRHKENNK